MENRQPKVEDYKAFSFSFDNPRVTTELSHFMVVALSVNYDINFNSATEQNTKHGSIKLTTQVVDLRYYDGQESLNLLIQERLGFSLSELVYWMVSPDFDNSIIYDDEGNIENPNGYKLPAKSDDNMAKKVVLRSIGKEVNADSVTTDLKGYIAFWEQGSARRFEFTISVTNTSGNNHGN